MTKDLNDKLRVIKKDLNDKFQVAKKDLDDKLRVVELVELLGRAQEQQIRLYVAGPNFLVSNPEYIEVDFLLHGYLAPIPASKTYIAMAQVVRELEAEILDSIKEARGKLETILEGDEDDNDDR